VVLVTTVIGWGGVTSVGLLLCAWYVPAGGGVGAPSVTWVLDELVVGDNNLDRVTPVSWERGRLGVLRLSSTDAGEHAGVRS
jgi:hypothetical protein